MKKKILSRDITAKQKDIIYNLFASVFAKAGIGKNNFNLILENNNDTPQILYHYTSLNTFQAILGCIEDEENKNSKSSKCNSFVLRGTHIKYVNDVTEFKPAVRLMAKLIQNYEISLNDNSNKHIADKLNEHYWENFATFHGMQTLPFITSFSDDSDNLPMWNTYGHDGKGVAIGIEKIKFDESKSGNPSWVRCIYEEKLLEDFFLLTIKEIYEMFDLREGHIVFNGLPNSNLIAKYFSTLKHFAYEYEQEWRLVKSYSSLDKNKEIKFQETNGLLKPYVEYKFPKSILKEVVIGPCSDMDISKKSLEMSLERVGYFVYDRDMDKDTYVSVKTSKIPYRHI
jgi:hypothetical protein